MLQAGSECFRSCLVETDTNDLHSVKKTARVGFLTPPTIQIFLSPRSLGELPDLRQQKNVGSYLSGVEQVRKKLLVRQRLTMNMPTILTVIGRVDEFEWLIARF
jgi:hypothetical protein